MRAILLWSMALGLLSCTKEVDQRTMQFEVKCHACYISYNAGQSGGANLWFRGTTDIVQRDSLVIVGDDTTVVVVTDTVPVQATWTTSFRTPSDMLNVLQVYHDSPFNDTIVATIYENGGAGATDSLALYRNWMEITY